MSEVASSAASPHLPVNFRAAYFYDTSGVARIPIKAELKTSSLQLKKKGGNLGGDLNVMGVAYAENGSVAARFSETLHVLIEKAKEEAFRRQGLAYENYLKLPGSYLFSEIARRVRQYSAEHTETKVISLGIGDVTRPLVPGVIAGLHGAAMGTRPLSLRLEDEQIAPRRPLGHAAHLLYHRHLLEEIVETKAALGHLGLHLGGFFRIEFLLGLFNERHDSIEHSLVSHKPAAVTAGYERDRNTPAPLTRYTPVRPARNHVIDPVPAP